MTRLLCKQVFFKIKPLSTTSHHATHSIGSMASLVIMARNLIGNTCKEDFDEKLMRVIMVRNLIDNTCKEEFIEKLISVCLFVFNLLCTAITPLHLRM